MSNIVARPWNKRKLTYRIAGVIPGIGFAEMQACARRAFDYFESISLLEFSEVASGEADININAGRIDGVGGTLAWSEVSDGRDLPRDQKYDRSEQWDTALNVSGRWISLEIVMRHEIGHALGLLHVPKEGEPCLLNANYNGNVRELSSRTLAHFQSWYGTPEAPEPGVIIAEVKEAIETLAAWSREQL